MNTCSMARAAPLLPRAKPRCPWHQLGDCEGEQLSQQVLTCATPGASSHGAESRSQAPGGTLLQDSTYMSHRKGKATVRISLCQGLQAREGQPGQGGRI